MLQDREAVAASFAAYVQEIDQNHNLADQLMQAYLKPGQELPRGRLRFQTRYVYPNRVVRMDSRRRGRFYSDGYHALVLGFKPIPHFSLWLAIASFSITREIKPPDNEKIFFEQPNPLIVQLQGLSEDTYKDAQIREAAVYILGRLRWEKLLVRNIAEWAQQADFTKVHILPSRLNFWDDVRTQQHQRGYLRYDVTARRCGFRLDERGIYTLTLSPPNSTPGVEL